MNKGLIIILIVIVLFLSVGLFFISQDDKEDSVREVNKSVGPIYMAENVSGEIVRGNISEAVVKENISEEVVNGIECPEILNFQTPVDVNKVTSVLYPGQIRGNDFKPHGGFRFDKLQSNEIFVKIPIDSRLVQGSRYLHEGVVQYMFDFETDCNVSYRIDHIYTLSDKLQEIVNILPEAKEGDSRTTQLDNVEFSKGEIIATEIGLPNNVFIDFGVYDYRKKNEASKTSQLVQDYSGEFASYAVCWFDWLPKKDAEILRSLPGADGKNGKNSEYC